jgi:AcrR family transcriptional regulator
LIVKFSIVEPSRTPRRTAGARPRGRAQRVVERVLRATAQELSEVGYAALRVEAVAARAGVNKTTIYRRWPTRAQLVAAAIELVKLPTPPETGSLEDDLVALLRNVVLFADSHVGAGILRVVQSERGHVELEPVLTRMRISARQRRAEVVARAIARGALPPDTDPTFVADIAFGYVMMRLLNFGERPTEAELRALVVTILAGVRARARDATTRGGIDDDPGTR